jgi:HlyD family secretion protein
VLRTISDDAVKREGYDAAFYKARIKLTSAELSNTPEGTHLLPGMSLRAEIKVGTRRVMTFFTYPLIRILDEGIREP